MFGIDDAIIGAGVGAVGSALGSWFSGASSAQGVRDANRANREIANQTNAANLGIARMNNRYNARQARQQMRFQSDQAGVQRDFQERMSGSSYQRAIADMKAAGINPLMAFQQGGASTPMGSSPSGASASASQIAAQTGAPAQPVPSKYERSIQSAMDAFRMKFEVDNMRKQNQKTSADIDLTQKLAAVAAAEKQNKVNSAEQIRINNELLKNKMPGSQFMSEIDKKKLKALITAIDLSETAAKKVKNKNVFFNEHPKAKTLFNFMFGE